MNLIQSQASGTRLLAKCQEARDSCQMTKTLLSLGHGYSAQALAAQLKQKGWRIVGTTRSTEKAAHLANLGVEPLIWPNASLLPALSQVTHLLVSIGSTENGDPVLNTSAKEIAAAVPHIEWAGYLSTTGVYGDHKGGWVDETTALTPTTQRGQWRLRAEEQWRTFAAQYDLPLHIFRLAGIYGPGRGPFEKVRDGTARLILKSDQFMSRIHVDDIAQVLEASINGPAPGTAYNVCDDEPSAPEDVLLYAAKLLGLPPPPSVAFDQAEMTPMARSFYSESKRVRNDLIKRELGVRLAYPSYREGLKALLAKMGG